jgi:hypothetical protein
VNAPDLLARLRRHYIKPGEALPGGVFLAEVQSPGSSYGTGGRRVDALYLGFTRSRGHTIEGHELKVSRSDWLHELDQADKAETWWKYCHRWWVVVPDFTVVKEEELPDGWGLMVPSSRTTTRMDIVRKARLKEPEVTFGLLLEVAKKLDTMREDAVRQARTEAEDAARERLKRQAVADLSREAEANKADAQRLRDLSTLTGLDLCGSWFVRDLAHVSQEEAATLLRQWCSGEATRRRLADDSRRTLRAIAAQARRVIEVAEKEGAE